MTTPPTSCKDRGPAPLLGSPGVGVGDSLLTPDWLKPVQTNVFGEPRFFHDPPDILILDGRLALSLGTVDYRGGDGRLWRAGFGMPFNGASIPPPASWIWNPHDPRWRRETLVHDERYSCAETFFDWRGMDCQKFADHDFLDGRRCGGMSGPRVAFFFGIRLAGYNTWRTQVQDALFLRWTRVEPTQEARNAWIKIVAKEYGVDYDRN